MATFLPAHVAILYADGSAAFATTTGVVWCLEHTAKIPSRLCFFQTSLADIVLSTSFFPVGVPYITVPYCALHTADVRDVAQCMIMVHRGLEMVTVTNHDPGLPAWLMLDLDTCAAMNPVMAFWILGESHTHFVYSRKITVPHNAIVWTHPLKSIPCGTL